MKKRNSSDDHSSIILLSTIIIVLVFVIISYIPPFTLGSFNVRRVNVFSDFLKFKDSIATVTSKEIVDTSFMADLPEEIVMQIAELSSVSETEPEERAVPPLSFDSAFAGAFEDYSDGYQMTAKMKKLLLDDSRTRCIHMSFFGDSFIEGDILTSSLRETLQNTYGGHGLGYIPFNDPRSNNRPYISQTASGWTCYSLLRKKNAPEKYREDFGVNGYISIPTPGARAVFSSRDGKGLNCSCAHIVFKNRGEARMDVILNGQDSLHYNLDSSPDVQQITLSGNIMNLEIRIPSCNDFVGYGVEFESDNGIYVDNYALRSHSGYNLVGTSKDLNRQFGEIVSQDIIVLEYGLNVLQKTVTDYSFYAKKLTNVVNFVHLCFPESVIIVMSVGDVGWNNDGTVVTAPAVRPMVTSQREASIQCGVMFWNTFQAMGGEGSMNELVRKGWAAKDFTHIRFEGGEMLSEKMAGSISGITEK